MTLGDDFVSMIEALKKSMFYGFDLLEMFSNDTPQLDSFCDLQGISCPKMSLFLLTTLQTVVFSWFGVSSP